MSRRTTCIAICVLFLFVASSTLNASEPWKEYDFGGQTVTIYNFFGTQWDWLRGLTFEDGEGRAHLEWVEEEFNVTVEFEHPGVHADFISNMAAHVMEGHSPAGIWFGQDQWMHILAAENLIRPLDDVLEEEYYESLPGFLEEPLRRVDSFAGTKYSFQFGPVVANESQAAIWNKDLFEREGLPDLYDLYEAGEWTWDALRDIAIRATRDTTGDGESDQWGVSARGAFGIPGDDPGHLWQQMIKWSLTNDGQIFREEDGRLLLALDEPQAIEAMEYWRDLEEQGVIGHPAGGPFLAGDIAVNLNNPGSGGEFPTFYEQMEEDYGAVPVPMGPRAEDHLAWERIRWSGAMLPITATQPRAKIELVNALYRLTDDYRDVETWEEEYFENFALFCRDRESLETYRWLTYNTRTLGPWELIEVNVPEFGAALQDVMRGEVGASSAVDQIMPPSQALLDEMLGF